MAGGHGGRNKVWTILRVVLVVCVIGLVLYWIVTGGIQRAWAVGQNFTNPIALIFGNGTSTGSFIKLPWQPEATRGPDISDYVQAADEQQSEADANNAGTQNNADVSGLQQYGDPSPYQGEVTISGNNGSADPAQEYIEIQASDGNSAPVEITGWTLQSAVSGKEGFIPQGTPIFQGGIVNTVQPVYLAAGNSAVVTTGASPVGVSFEQNICSGYLGRLQSFYPALDDSCPSPSDELPQTAQNLKTYGASCFDYVNNLSSCEFPGTSMPANLSQACRSFLATTLSYNGCVAMHRSQSNFELPSWRVYLAMRYSLWNESHDIVRLLDNSGRVVDVLSY